MILVYHNTFLVHFTMLAPSYYKKRPTHTRRWTESVHTCESYCSCRASPLPLRGPWPHASREKQQVIDALPRESRELRETRWAHPTPSHSCRHTGLQVPLQRWGRGDNPTETRTVNSQSPTWTLSSVMLRQHASLLHSVLQCWLRVQRLSFMPTIGWRHLS